MHQHYLRTEPTKYIKTYKLKSTTEEIIKVAAVAYEPANKKTEYVSEMDKENVIENTSTKERFKSAIYFLPVFIILVITFAFNNLVSLSGGAKENQLALEELEIPSLFQNHFSSEFDDYLNSYYFSKNTGIPYEFQYHDLNLKVLYEYLNAKESLLAESDYVSIIITHSKKNNVNPTLLLAIIGQEQSFVNKNTEHSEVVINNPYNVFGSWIEYNTNFEDATIVCINTIVNSAKKRPEGRGFIEWLNYTYAEDENWSKGVNSIFTSLQNLNSK